MFNFGAAQVHQNHSDHFCHHTQKGLVQFLLNIISSKCLA
jgi:hypothetical protein